MGCIAPLSGATVMVQDDVLLSCELKYEAILAGVCHD